MPGAATRRQPGGSPTRFAGRLRPLRALQGHPRGGRGDRLHRRRARRGAAAARHRDHRDRRLDAPSAPPRRRAPRTCPTRTRASRRCSPTSASTSSTSRRPNHLHDEQVRATLAAGKHVVCEKPLAMNSAQTGELLELANASGLVHAVNFNQRFYPKNLHARAIVARRRPRHGPARHRRLPAGLAALRHRLELAPGARARRRPARDRRHRLALAGPLELPHRPARARRDGRPDDVHADPARSRSAASRRSPTRRRPRPSTARSRPRTPPACSSATRTARAASSTLSQVSAGRKNHLNWEINGSEASAAWRAERPEELWIGRRDTPERAAAARSRPARAARRRAHEHARRPRRGLRRDVPRALPGRLPRGRRGRAAGRARLPDLRRRPRAGARRGRDRALARGGPVGRSGSASWRSSTATGRWSTPSRSPGEAWRRALKPYGYAVTDEDLAATVGIPYARTHAYLAERADDPRRGGAVAGALARAVRADRRAAGAVRGCAAGGRGPAGAGRARSPSPPRRRASGWTARWPAPACSSTSRSPATRSSTASPRRTCSCSRRERLGVEPAELRRDRGLAARASPPGRRPGMPTLGVRRVPRAADLDAAPTASSSASRADDILAHSSRVMDTRGLIRYGGDFWPEPIVRASGSYLETASGRRVLDFTAGQICATIGHNHPRVTEAGQARARRRHPPQLVDALAAGARSRERAAGRRCRPRWHARSSSPPAASRSRSPSGWRSCTPAGSRSPRSRAAGTG